MGFELHTVTGKQYGIGKNISFEIRQAWKWIRGHYLLLQISSYSLSSEPQTASSP